MLSKMPGSVAVVTPIGWDHHRNRYNINADHAAFALAVALKAQRLVFVSDVPGVLSDKDDPSSVIPQLGKTEIEALIASGAVSAGMIPKLMNSLASVEAGVQSVSIVSGKDDSALCQLIQGDSSVGTTIVAGNQPVRAWTDEHCSSSMATIETYLKATA
jgi:acetylglutamate kinase